MAGAAAGLASCALLEDDDERNGTSEQVYSDEIQINPNIHNLRVAMAKDDAMVKGGAPSSWDFETVNNSIDKEAVHTNMDAMAKYLTQKSIAKNAWANIFRKPSSKAWSDVRAAFKVNCIESKQMTKLAIVEKICIEIHRLGVPYENMVVWDGCHNASGNSKYTPFKGGNGLPEGVEVSNKNTLLGGTTSTYVPAPWNGQAQCTADLADGNIDILVNFAVNKGHGASRGSCTLSMKNHFGTFNPEHGHEGDAQDQFNYLIAMNKSDAIVGGSPIRQQLIVMDSIFAMTGGPGGTPNHEPHVLLMGTFAPAVDYATAKLIREKEMGASHSSYLEEFLPSFGYSEAERDDFINKSPDENEGRGVGRVSA